MLIMKVYFNNSCKICKAEIDLYKKEKTQEIEWIDITNNELAKKETIHFIGIGGIGMSGLSLIMKGQGFKVQGSDVVNNKNIDDFKKYKLKFNNYCEDTNDNV